MKKKIAKLLPLFFIFSLFAMSNPKVYAADLSKNLEQTNTKITEFKVTNTEGNVPANGFGATREMKVSIGWDASTYENNLKSGDYFIVNLPKEFWFPVGSNKDKFDLYSPDGKDIIGKASLMRKVNNSQQATDQVRVVFTDYVENRYDIKGSMFLTARFERTLIKQPSKQELTVSIGSNINRETVQIAKSTTTNPIIDEMLNKYTDALNNKGNVRWGMRINHKEASLENVVLKDTLSAESGHLMGVSFIPDTFKLEQVTYNETGHYKVISTKKIGADVQFNENYTSFEYHLGDTNRKQYRLSYESTYAPQLRLKNTAELISTEESGKDIATFHSSGSGGQGQGDLVGKIKVIKVDEKEQPIELAGAIFKVTRISTGGSFTLSTNDKGEAVSARLIPGQYEIQEVTPPTGYLKDDQTYTVEVSSDKAAIITIKNEAIKTDVTNVNGKKIWQDNENYNGNRPDSITVNLLANGIQIDSKEVTAINDWNYSFTDLPSSKDGTRIKYTIEEVPVEGYTAKITGSLESGFIITNTEDAPFTPIEPGRISVDVAKEWIGEKRASVTINLFADGKKIDSVELNEKNNWKHTFEKLPVVNDVKDEKVIEYTVEEVEIDGYRSEITGNVQDGYLVTNTAKTYAVGDYVWIDQNKNGLQDEGEAVLAGVGVELFDQDGNSVGTTTTNSDGLYIFDNLPAGNYHVKFTLTTEQAAKYKFTQQNVGEDSRIDSDANENGLTKEFTLDDTNSSLTKAYKTQGFEATEGIDPTWDAGVIEKEPLPPIEPEEPSPEPEPEEPSPKPEPEEPSPEPEPKEPTPETDEPTPGPEKLPKTGEANNNLLTIMGILLITLGIGFLDVQNKEVTKRN